MLIIVCVRPPQTSQSTRRQRDRRGTRCETCGYACVGEEIVALIASPTRRIYLCRPCCEDTWRRRDAEARVQHIELEFWWGLSFDQTADRHEDGDIPV